MSFNLGKVKGSDGKGITSITKTGTSGLIDTYTITYTDGSTSTFTVTNGTSGADIVTAWETTLSDSKVPSEKLVKNTIDNKASTNHSHGNLTRDGKIGSTSGKAIITGTGGVLEASSLKTINNESIIGSGNIHISGGGSADIVTEWESTLSDEKVPSEKLTKNTLDGKANSTHTHTKSQITDFSHTHSISDVTDLQTNLNAKVNASDIANNLTTTASGKVLDARQGKALKDYIDGLVGDIENDMLL